MNIRRLLPGIGLIALACVLTPMAASAQVNVVVNGSFEADQCSGSGTGFRLGLIGDAVTGWFIPASDGTYPWCLQNVNAFSAGPTPYGNQWLVLGRVGSGNQFTIQQKIDGLTPGKTYKLSFAIASESGCCSIAEVSFPSGSSTAPRAFVAPASGQWWTAWATMTMDFTATATSVTLQFKDLSTGGGIDLGLDNVQIQAAESFAISLTTFIPGNQIFGPAWHPDSWCDFSSFSTQDPAGRLVFGADDRGFNPVGTTFRARQLVTIATDESVDPDGLVEGSDQNLTGITRSFATDALDDGTLNAADRDGVLGDCHLQHAEAPPEKNGMAISVRRLGPQRVLVNLRTGFRGPDDPLVTFATAIDWEFVIIVDTSGEQPTYELTGTWDGFPAVEIYVNDQPIYLFSVGNGPYTFANLLRLQPGVGDVRVNTSGVLSR